MHIYKITNLVNNKMYIGQTTRNVAERWKQHFYRKDTVIGLALKKYDKKEFKFEIIKKCNNLDELNYFEEKYIKEYNTISPNGYNLKKGGNNFKQHEETKRKIGLIHKGKKLSKSQKTALVNSRKGKTCSKEHKKRISESLKGRKFSQVHRNRLSKVRKGRIFCKYYPVVGFKDNESIYLKHANIGKSLGFNPNHIRACCRGERNHHRGYVWQRVNE